MAFPENFADELLLLVFQYLDTEDLVRLSLVSRKWRQLFDDPKFLKKIFQSKTNYLPSETPRLWKKIGETQNSYSRILCDTKFLYFLDLLNSLTPVELFYYVMEVLCVFPKIEDTIREERLEIILATPTLLKKLANLDVEVITKGVRPLLKLKRGELPHTRAKKFIEAMLTIPEFTQAICGESAAELARLGISPKFLLKGNEERYTSEDIYQILKYYAKQESVPAIEEVLELLEGSILFEKIGNEKFLNMITSDFAGPLLEKTRLLEKLSCKDIFRIMEIMFDVSDEGAYNLDLISPDKIIIEPNKVFRRYIDIIKEKTDFTEEMAKKVTTLNQSFEKLMQDVNETFVRLVQNKEKIEKEFDTESDTELEISEDFEERLSF